MQKSNLIIAKKNRNLNLDLIRCIAVCSVISVHFFLNIGFYQEITVGKRMVLMNFMRTCFMVCVPLFLILTGYLMNRKKLSRNYYTGIVHTLAIYIIISSFCILYKILILKQEANFILEILNFTGSYHAWYIEMYIGLFLIIPFLNMIYHGLETKRQKKVLLFTVFFLVTVPAIFNIFGIKVIPSWWINIWPILYYFIGCYLNEYKPHIPKVKNMLLLLLVFIFSTGFNLYRNMGKCFEWGMYNDWYGIENLLSSVLLFVLVDNININNIPSKLKWCIQSISKLSLGIYLSSWITEDYFYSRLNERVGDVIYRVNCFPIAVIIVFVAYTFYSLIAEIIYKITMRFIKRIAKIKFKYNQRK